MTPSTPTILLVDDDSRQRDLLASHLEANGFSTQQAENGKAALAALAAQHIDLVISDIRMPEMTGIDLLTALRTDHPALPVLLITAYADVRGAVHAMRDGAANYLEKPVDLDEMLQSIRHALGISLDDTADTGLPDMPDDVVIASPAMRDVIREVVMVAPSEARVLITGENGTGKEVIADLIHGWSKRAKADIAKLNCAAIPENLLESELFGHEKGAFSGATAQRDGLFLRHDGGTVFLDEIGEIPMALQPKLLRVIQDGTFRALGSDDEKRCDVRILAATNRDLEEEVAEGRFREDLFFRLNTFEVYVPPLRERREDIMPLASHFANTLGDGRKRFSSSVAALLNAYDWPGNVRELRNAVERSMLMAGDSDTVLPEHLPSRIRKYAAPAAPAAEESDGPTPLEDLERMTILQALQRNDYNRSATARELGMSRRALIYKIRRLRDAGFTVDPS